ncbi:MAG: 4-alpha-glucanotransferase [Nitrospirae bacterium GWB2_47_37]|nr:MAG: 4-alpha-glucanotransferase [Nitrospirae bacterium GWB2_47_37]HAK88124.1 4-alpha-glucanotransferase [Nitrospiraceae bacterium]
MPTHDELINELAGLCGVIPEYWDIFGNKHTVSLETQKAILKIMRLNIGSEENIQKEIAELKTRPWNRFIEPVTVISINDQPLTIPLYIPVEEGKESELSISWSIENESGQRAEFILEGNSITVSDQRRINGKRHIKINLNDRGNRGIGYYTVSVLCKTPEIEISGKSRVIITPDACRLPAELEHGKTWGLSINLYSIRSDRNWGVGDFADLKKLVEWAAGLKAGFIGINPLHAIPNKKPFGISPYSPISRLYKNFIYLDVENIPEVRELTAHEKEIQDKLNELRREDLIDYEKVASLKENILRSAFKSFYENHYEQNSQRGLELKNYIAQEGNDLEMFTTYMALASLVTHHSPLFSWQEWPDEYRNPYSYASQEFKKTYKKVIIFHAYIQWLIDGQFREISEHAKDLGMSVGIYHDLAIGSIGGGSDAWPAQEIIADGTDLGAPPDDFNAGGQNWGFPPLIPEKLKESGYDYFIQTIRKNMKHCGALRIDHALGMFRQFWIPKDMPASQGAYVRLPSEDLLRIIALESVRNKTMVIAEDLGTIGENVRETLLRFGMLSYRLLYFERNYPDPSFTTPGRYPDTALCAVTTHDLPTIYGWWSGRDIEEKKRLGMYPDEGVWLRNICDRERDKEFLINALRAEGILPHGSELFTSKPMSPELCLAIYEFLARTPCKLVCVSLDDVIGTPDQQNMPGITDSYPSWMQKTPIPLEQIIPDVRFSVLSKMFQKNSR